MDPVLVLRLVLTVVATVVVVGGIGGLGYALGRLVASRRGPTLPDGDGRRLEILEEEVDLLQSELKQLREEGDFFRLLPRPDDESEQARAA